MVFSELFFLYAFLPLNLLCYFFAKDIRTKNSVMLVFSLVFYSWGEPVYLLLLLGLVAANWFFALWIGMARRKRNTREAKLMLILTCIVDLGAIGIFKYLSFFLGNTHALFGFPQTIPSIVLPIGISFYTFQILSYVIDVYRGDVAPQRSFRRLLLYVSLFHQCIAGPIVRYKDVCEEIMHRTTSWRDTADGVTRFTIGLAKKAIFANHCGFIADQLLGTAAAPKVVSAPAAALWLGMLAYSMQIYLDFSAYSDMAIGMGRMIGFHYKENFNYPYISQSITDFWRRWHMSLSSFFRDYVYIPLGGNRRGLPRQIINLFVVWALTGLWHGASWNFVLWGLYFFVFLVVEKFFLAEKMEKWPRILRHLYVLFAVFVSWILFRFESLADVGTVIIGLFGLTGNGFGNFETGALWSRNYVFVFVAMVACTPLAARMAKWIQYRAESLHATRVVWGVLYMLFPIALLLISTALLVGDSYNPFLYFQF